jgi:hypothetical protein
MKGVYLTEEGKKAIEDRIVELEKDLKEEVNPFICIDVSAELNTYKRILSSATILPVEESWENALTNTEVTDCIYSSKMNCPNGVIIKSKEQ